MYVLRVPSRTDSGVNLFLFSAVGHNFCPFFVHIGDYLILPQLVAAVGGVSSCFSPLRSQTIVVAWWAFEEAEATVVPIKSS